jgi:phosphopantetheinyl transferase
VTAATATTAVRLAWVPVPPPLRSSASRRGALDACLQERETARRAARRALARLLGVPVSGLRLEKDELGRPFLADAYSGTEISFSRAPGVTVVALSECGRIGVDVERADRDVDAEAVSRRFFTERERLALAALGPTERRRTFFEWWTWKEAVLKAAGLGIRTALPDRLGSAADVSVRAPLRSLEHAATWWPEPAYVVTVVTEGARPDVRMVPLNPEELSL